MAWRSLFLLLSDTDTDIGASVFKPTNLQYSDGAAAQREPQWLLLVGTLGMFGAAVAVQTLLIFTFMPWLAYQLRAWRGPGQVVLSSMRIVIPLATVVAFLWLMVW